MADEIEISDDVLDEALEAWRKTPSHLGLGKEALRAAIAAAIKADRKSRLAFENGDWFWDADDPDISDDNPYNVVWEQPYGVIVHVKASIQVADKFGFLLEPPPDAENSDSREFWFDTREEAEAALARNGGDHDKSG